MTDLDAEDQEPKTPEDWGQDYRQELGSWTDFTERVEKLIFDLLRERQIDVVQIESRTKSPESFVGKIKRKAEKYIDPLTEITDLTGLRVITYYSEDVERVITALKVGFDLDLENSRGTIRAQDSDRFGYQSAQYVVRIGKSRRALAEWKPYKDRPAEVQVRTALQHGWSAIEHKLSYKAEREVPRHLKRKLSRLSALLELADEEFSALRDAIDDLAAHYDKEIGSGHLDVAVDAESVASYVRSKTGQARIKAAIRKVAYELDDQDETVFQRDRRDLVEILQLLDVNTIEALDNILLGASAWAPSFLSELRLEAEKTDFSVDLGTTFDLVLMLVLFDARADSNLVDAAGYTPGFQGVFAAVVANSDDG